MKAKYKLIFNGKPQEILEKYILNEDTADIYFHQYSYAAYSPILKIASSGNFE